jgi:hypothetical protein
MTDAAPDPSEPPELPTIDDLDALTDLVSRERSLFVRWSRGPAFDVESRSRDELTGVPLPGLCANPLSVEAWWGDRPVRTWVARRLYDYRHLQDQRGPDVRPWVLEGIECGRGPDNEPLVGDVRPIAWVADHVIADAIDEVHRASRTDEWGPLRRSS